jgi:hypothetical protein
MTADIELATMRDTSLPTAERRAAFRARNKRLLAACNPPQGRFLYGVPGEGIAIDCGLCSYTTGTWPDDGSAESNFYAHFRTHNTREI